MGNPLKSQSALLVFGLSPLMDHSLFNPFFKKNATEPNIFWIWPLKYCICMRYHGTFVFLYLYESTTQKLFWYFAVQEVSHCYCHMLNGEDIFLVNIIWNALLQLSLCTAEERKFSELYFEISAFGYLLKIFTILQQRGRKLTLIFFLFIQISLKY